MSPLTVLFFGIQGSGKGTQVKLLAEAIQKKSSEPIIMVDMGALMRASVATGSVTGVRTGEIINVGKRMPDFMPVFLSTKAFDEGLKTNNEHLICDGLCRGEDQTRAFDDAMQFYGRENYHIVSLELSEEETTKRLLLRARKDDTPEGIASRLAWYKTDVMPQLELLRGRGRTVHAINGDQSVEAVHADIIKALGM